MKESRKKWAALGLAIAHIEPSTAAKDPDQIMVRAQEKGWVKVQANGAMVMTSDGMAVAMEWMPSA